VTNYTTLDLFEYFFAYGSNVCAERLKKRDICFHARRAATLPCCELVFSVKDDSDHPSSRYIGYANIVKSVDSHVEGALYTVEANLLHRLDRFEQEYERLAVSVECQGSIVNAFTYVALEKWTGTDLLPPSWYMRYFLAADDIFSPEYQRFLKDHPVVEIDEDESLDGVYNQPR